MENTNLMTEFVGLATVKKKRDEICFELAFSYPSFHAFLFDVLIECNKSFSTIKPATKKTVLLTALFSSFLHLVKNKAEYACEPYYWDVDHNRLIGDVLEKMLLLGAIKPVNKTDKKVDSLWITLSDLVFVLLTRFQSLAVDEKIYAPVTFVYKKIPPSARNEKVNLIAKKWFDFLSQMTLLLVKVNGDLSKIKSIYNVLKIFAEDDSVLIKFGRDVIDKNHHLSNEVKAMLLCQQISSENNLPVISENLKDLLIADYKKSLALVLQQTSCASKNNDTSIFGSIISTCQLHDLRLIEAVQQPLALFFEFSPEVNEINAEIVRPAVVEWDNKSQTIRSVVLRGVLAQKSS